jgi:hypothetical protein
MSKHDIVGLLILAAICWMVSQAAPWYAYLAVIAAFTLWIVGVMVVAAAQASRPACKQSAGADLAKKIIREGGTRSKEIN